MCVPCLPQGKFILDCCCPSPFTPCHTHWTLPPAQRWFFSSRNGGEEQKCVAEVWERGKLLCKSWHGKYKNYVKVANQESNSSSVEILKKRHYRFWMQQSNESIPWFCASKVLTRLLRLEASDIELNFLYCVGYMSSHLSYIMESIFWYILCETSIIFFSQNIAYLGGITRDNIRTCI